MIEQYPIIDHFAITPRARVTWLADLRHQGTVTTTWPEGTADITWDTGWYSTRVPLTQLRRLATCTPDGEIISDLARSIVIDPCG